MNDHGNERMPKWKTVTAVLNYEEWRELKHLARKNRVLTRDYLRGIVIDALIEERELALQRSGQETRAIRGEERQVGGVPTS